MYATIAAPVLVAAVLFAGLAVRAGGRDGFRFLVPISAGTRYTDPRELLPGQKLVPGDGYDGQFYFFIAQDPLLQKSYTAHSLDSPYRYRRILYPLLAFAAALGRRDWLPFSLLAINVLACIAMVALLAVAARRSRVTPWAALLVAVNVGTWLPLLLDLTEPLQNALLAAGFVFDSAVLMFLAGLAKETAYAPLAAELCRRAWRRDLPAALRAGAALAVALAWAVAVNLAVHARSRNFSANALDQPAAPFVALVSTARRGFFPELLLVVALATIFATLARLIWRRDAAALGAAAYFLAVLAGSADLWNSPLGFLRVMSGGFVLLFLSWVQGRDRLAGVTLWVGAVEGGLLLLGGVTVA